MSLARAIFHYNYPWFDVGDNTKLNNMGEAFCYGDKKKQIFFTPRAEAVIQGVARRGDRIETGSYSRAWDRFIQSIVQGNEEKLSDFVN